MLEKKLRMLEQDIYNKLNANVETWEIKMVVYSYGGGNSVQHFPRSRKAA